MAQEKAQVGQEASQDRVGLEAVVNQVVQKECLVGHQNAQHATRPKGGSAASSSASSCIRAGGARADRVQEVSPSTMLAAAVDTSCGSGQALGGANADDRTMKSIGSTASGECLQTGWTVGACTLETSRSKSSSAALGGEPERTSSMTPVPVCVEPASSSRSPDFRTLLQYWETVGKAQKESK